jgi:glycosyltransferase involved in cell wall biosynthesis
MIVPEEEQLIDVIIRTKNSEEFLKECLQSIYEEIPVRHIIIVDAGSTDKTLEIASSFDKVDVYVKPDLNLGQATKYAFTKAQTEWVAVVDSDIILRKGWFENMKRYMKDCYAVEGSRIDHYRFNLEYAPQLKNSRYGVFGQTLLKREPVLSMEIDLPFGEDAAIKYNLEKQGLKWKKVENYLADHYPKIVNGSTYRRTGTVFIPVPFHIPKAQQVEEGHIYRKYNMITKKQALSRLIIPTTREALRAFRARFWFFLAYFKII